MSSADPPPPYTPYPSAPPPQGYNHGQPAVYPPTHAQQMQPGYGYPAPGYGHPGDYGYRQQVVLVQQPQVVQHQDRDKSDDAACCLLAALACLCFCCLLSD